MLVFKTVFKTAIFRKILDGEPTKIAKVSQKIMKNSSVAAQEVRRRGARCAIVSVVAPAPFVAGAPTSTTRTNMRAPHRLTTSHCLRSMPCRSGRCARSLHRARNALCSVSCSYVTTIPAQRAAACAAALIFPKRPLGLRVFSTRFGSDDVCGYGYVGACRVGSGR